MISSSFMRGLLKFRRFNRFFLIKEINKTIFKYYSKKLNYYFQLRTVTNEVKKSDKGLTHDNTCNNSCLSILLMVGILSRFKS